MRDIAIVGAGPYGLSLAAHLQGEGSDFRIFGTPMQSWTDRMPKGMHLKSEGFASTLYDGGGRFPFSRYCRDNNLPYADVGEPVNLEDFANYGLAFQERFVPNLERKQVENVRRVASGFEVRLDDGETALFRRVILAIGIGPFGYIPPGLKSLPASVLSHASDHHDMVRFAGRTVAVVGGGSSVTDCAAALVRAGAKVQIVTRGPRLKFHAPPSGRSILNRIRWPLTTIGTGWRAIFCAKAPLVFHAMPQRFRHDVTRRYLGPVSCWFTRDLIEGNAEIHTKTEVSGAEVQKGRARVILTSEGRQSELEVDHVIAATGYRVDIDRLEFLDPALRSAISVAEKTPVLSRFFESSVQGLHFVGVTSSNAFGPLVRFACGAEFTAGRLSRHLVRKAIGSGQARMKPGLRSAPLTAMESGTATDAF